MADQTSQSLNPAETPSSPAVASPPQQTDIIAANDEHDNEVEDDADSTLGTDAESSTASVSASILEYRRSQGRTYHSDKFTTNYFLPNDDQQLESVDLTYIGRATDPFVLRQKVLDVGTGTGIWAIEFADRHPNAEIIGTDLSPCQPEWVPPNVRFEIDDAALNWTWEPNEFDFIHIRYIFGAIKDWSALFSEAYRCCVPGGWVQSAEADVEFRSDDGTIDKEPNLKLYKKLFEEGGKILGYPFFVYDQQVQGFKDAGFEDVTTVDYKLPVGDWPKDPKLAEVGRFVRACLETDLEGYTTMMWNELLKWPKDEYQLFLMSIRKAIRNPKIHTYMRVRYVYGRKPSSQ
ncbi:hypothetical protein FocTR4_00009442 [Fusarium oxysporum f. sp. cubense]|uniref:TAM domain methyltransferase n=1 Tax=Fusarium oxysporum f. sp. cubense TaxID=61366 RepID=A0A5C6SU02_FUSOC|nr:hypothetical protein FocTR4_00009442 [Fusarium oxysporum f. sp. cubense]